MDNSFDQVMNPFLRESSIRRFSGEYSFLSNFYPAPIVFERIRFPTAEHAYQAAKTRDPNIKMMVARAATPGRAKRLGQRIPIRPDWERIKVDVMHKIVRIKFLNYPELAEKLINTGDRCLIEGNDWNDTFWGVDSQTGEGRNTLGNILMMVREELGRSLNEQ